MIASLYEGKRILVTGATGLLGRHLVPRLLERGANVRTAARGQAPACWKNIDHCRGDLLDPAFAARICDGMDGLFHLAGLRGSIGLQQKMAASLMGDNLLLDLNIFKASLVAGIARRVYVSTVTVYPDLEEYHEDLAWSDNPHPSAEYVAWSKRMAEKFLEAQAVQFGQDTAAVLRLVNSFGPFDDFDPETALVVPALIHRVLSGEDPLVVWGDGSAVRDFLYVEDAIAGLLRGYEAGIGEGPINLGSGTGYSIKDIVQIVVAASELSPSIQWDVSKPSGAAKKVLIVDKARDILGFTPAVDLETAIARTLDWYKSQRADTAN